MTDSGPDGHDKRNDAIGAEPDSRRSGSTATYTPISDEELIEWRTMAELHAEPLYCDDAIRLIDELRRVKQSITFILNQHNFIASQIEHQADVLNQRTDALLQTLETAGVKT